MKRTSGTSELLTPLAAAHHLGITPELLFLYTRPSFVKSSGLRRLESVEQAGQTLFSVEELDRFDVLLAGPWPKSDRARSDIPRGILDHLRAESLNQCARCGRGIGVQTAHIVPFAVCRSHHHANLLRICSSCHNEHDIEHSLPTDVLLALKKAVVERTRANLKSRMNPSQAGGRVPRGASKYFGCERELSDIIDALRSNRSALITGAGGTGKTELLLQALAIAGTGRPVFWIDVEHYRGVSEIVATLRAAVGQDGMACPQAALPGRLDQLQACVVFDGIEQTGLEDLDALEDMLTNLHAQTAAAQFIATSQIMLHRFVVDCRIKIGKLDVVSSRRLLESQCLEPNALDESGAGRLLDFCEGHALTLRLAGALINHYGTPAAALRAIKEKGISIAALPGRQRYTRSTSLQLCLITAYDALGDGARRLLWALSASPAGLFAHYIEADWLKLGDPLEAQAELRRWHLIDRVLISGDRARVQVLGPIRAFAADCGNRGDAPAYAALLNALAHGQTLMMAVLEHKYDDPEDTPYLLQRFSEELPNLLHTFERAKADPTDRELVVQAIAIVRPLMQYFFVLRLLEEGARIMHEAAELAFASGEYKLAAGLTQQFFGLVQRDSSHIDIQRGLVLIGKIETATQDIKVLADLAMCRGVAARETGDNESAERFARSASKAYHQLIGSEATRATQNPDGNDPESADHENHHNDAAYALSLLGSALLGQKRFEEALKTYHHALHHQRGGGVAVNSGQLLHQIGLCHAHLTQSEKAAPFFFQAAEIFAFVGMQEYLSNAISELGYVIVDIEAGPAKTLETSILEAALTDMRRDISRIFDPSRPLDQAEGNRVVRKLFGCIITASLLGEGAMLGPFGTSVGDSILPAFGQQIQAGERNSDEAPLLQMLQSVLQLALLDAEAEESYMTVGTVSDEVIGDMLRMICHSPQWARSVLRVIDWFSALLTRRWCFDGGGRERLREFVMNFDDDITDYLDLSRKSGC